jgi:hypothetical protein
MILNTYAMGLFQGKDKEAKEEKERKPFGETKIGEFLKDKAPNILDAVSNILPDKGGLGILKNIISKDDTLSETDKVNAVELIDAKLRELEVHAQDRDSARKREVDLAKAGGTDWMMYVVGLVGLGLLVFIVMAVVFMPELSENLLLTHILGIVEGVCTSIFFYYFGSSKSSADKNKIIDKTL